MELTAKVTRLRQPAASPPESPGSRRSGRFWLRLFPDPPARPVGARAIILAVVAVLVGAAVSLVRTGGSGPFNSIWAEDVTNFLSDSLTKHVWTAVLTPVNGYYLVVPRLQTEIAKFFGVGLMPAVMSIEAALSVAGLAVLVYVASAAHLSGVLPRLLVCVPVIAGPIYGSVPNNLATLQFSLLYVAFWMLLWCPRRRLAQLVAITVLVATGVTTILAVLLLPLALLRIYTRRGRTDLVCVGAFLASTCLQAVPHLLGLTPRVDPGHIPRYDPVWALGQYVAWGLPREVLGQNWLAAAGTTRSSHILVVASAWAVVLCTVLAGTARLTRPDWMLAGVAFAFSVLVFTASIMLIGSVQFRYALSSGLILLVCLAALVRPRSDRGRLTAVAPVGALLVLLLAVGAANLRYDDYRDHVYSWSSVLHRGSVACQQKAYTGNVVLFTGHGGPWHAVVPCRFLRR